MATSHSTTYSDITKPPKVFADEAFTTTLDARRNQNLFASSTCTYLETLVLSTNFRLVLSCGSENFVRGGVHSNYAGKPNHELVRSRSSFHSSRGTLVNHATSPSSTTSDTRLSRSLRNVFVQSAILLAEAAGGALIDGRPSLASRTSSSYSASSTRTSLSKTASSNRASQHQQQHHQQHLSLRGTQRHRQPSIRLTRKSSISLQENDRWAETCSEVVLTKETFPAIRTAKSFRLIITPRLNNVTDMFELVARVIPSPAGKLNHGQSTLADVKMDASSPSTTATSDTELVLCTAPAPKQNCTFRVAWRLEYGRTTSVTTKERFTVRDGCGNRGGVNALPPHNKSSFVLSLKRQLEHARVDEHDDAVDRVEPGLNETGNGTEVASNAMAPVSPSLEPSQDEALAAVESSTVSAAEPQVNKDDTPNVCLKRAENGDQLRYDQAESTKQKEDDDNNDDNNDAEDFALL